MALGARIREGLLTPARRMSLPVLSGPARGVRLEVGPSSPRWLSGRIEAAVQREYAALVGPGAVVYDVGANIGFYTLLAARLAGPPGRVVAYEPNPVNAAVLRRNARSAPAVLVREAAVAAGTGPRGLQTSASLTSRLTDDPGALRVACTTIDAEVAAGVPAPNVVKIDVEGAETDVLAGMQATLAQHRPVLLIELHGRNAEVAAALAAAGYEHRVIETPALALVAAGPEVHVVCRPAASR